jgi:hypothetical protein
MSLTGSGRLKSARCAATTPVNLNGSGQLFRPSGAVRSLTARANGSGSLDLAGLSSDQADLTSNGSGGITANVQPVADRAERRLGRHPGVRQAGPARYQRATACRCCKPRRRLLPAGWAGRT